MTTLRALAQSTMLGSTDDSLLVSAITTGISELGGFIPTTFEGGVPACPAESKSQMPEKASELLKRILAGEFEGILPEFLQLTAEHGCIVPPETLPTLLGLGKNELRPLVLPVIGERGRWLAAHNPAWGYALGRNPLEAWEHGSRLERVAALEQIRAVEPRKAREWVQSTWEQDAPEDRAALLSAFSTGLSMGDEPFLESCLDDKRKEVRETARSLLMRLENSRFVARMWARAKPLIRVKSKFLGGDSLEVSLPETLDTAAKRDGLGGASSHKGMGEKAGLLTQILSFVPPALWNRELGRPPEKLITAALHCEWKESLLLGWQLAAQKAADVAWAESLAPLWATLVLSRNNIFDLDSIDDLVMLMRVEKVESLVTSSIKPILSELDDKNLLISPLAKYKRPWTVKMSRTVIQSAQRQSGDHRYNLPQNLPGFAQWIPPELADEFSSGWAAEPKGYWGSKTDEFLRILHFRNEIRESFKI
jgi:hypothetical protein